ncbi:DNA cytosine methyltransferase [Jeotgalibaca porci]|uniref:DNA cytosine methyltransferase n=1 Tax=Jeotgalibaca porci TaxID=1868793 RepID=UPI00359FBB8B
MKFLDLFAGIGGFRLGLERAGHECIGHVEIDKYARKSYEAMHNTEGEWVKHDITTITNEEWAGLRGTVDIIAGGFPCQAFSVAGKRGGFDDTRGTLFFEIARAAKQIKPRILFLENVKGLLSHDKGNTFGTILRTLDELGYDTEWQLLNSKNFGVPQNRERVFIIGHLRGAGGREIFPIEGTNGEVDVPIEIIAHRKNYRRNTQVFSPAGITEALDTGQGGGRGHYTVVEPFIVDDQGRRNKELTPMAISPTLRAQSHGNEPKVVKHGLLIREATNLGYTIATEGDSVNLQFPDSKTRRGRVGTQLANTLQASGANQGVLVSQKTGIRETNQANTIDANYFKGLGNNQQRTGVTNGFSIRKLTPRECWRLQGFPDWAFDRAREVNSNSQLYKQAGNSVTVNVIEAIAKKL